MIVSSYLIAFVLRSRLSLDRIRNPFRLCAISRDPTKKSAREIRQEKINKYNIAHPPADKDDMPKPSTAENSKETGVEQHKDSEMNGKAILASFSEEKKEDDRNKVSANGQHVPEATSFSSFPTRATSASRDDEEGAENGKEGEGQAGIKQSTSMTETPLCGVCGCF
jgi:hypothetical protein